MKASCHFTSRSQTSRATHMGLLLLLSEAAVANGKAEAASKLLNERSSELNSAIEEDLRKDEEKAKVAAKGA